MPPVETFMDVPSRLRKEHLSKVKIPLFLAQHRNLKLKFVVFKYLEPGDLVIGCVDHINEIGIHMHMNCFDSHKQRDLTRAKLNVSLNYYSSRGELNEKKIKNLVTLSVSKRNANYSSKI